MIIQEFLEGQLEEKVHSYLLNDLQQELVVILVVVSEYLQLIVESMDLNHRIAEQITKDMNHVITSILMIMKHQYFQFQVLSEDQLMI